MLIYFSYINIIIRLHLHSFTNLTTSYHKSQDFSVFSSQNTLNSGSGPHSNRE